MDGKNGNGLAKGLGVALVRWALGLMFLVGGVSKLFMLKGFVTGYLAPAFEKTFLPGWLVMSYGYALPFVEAILGLLLIVGCCRTFTLFVTGLTLISLAFGQMLVQGHAIVANIMLYILMTAVALFVQEHDRCGWPWCCGKRGESKAE
jgi:thiosulfate dehydrogenase [quinone] large subunit